MAYYGYARCSTDESRQDVERQARNLAAKGAETIVREYGSGIKHKREKLTQLLSELTAGDTLAVTEVSRLTRSLRQLCDILKEVETRKVRLICGTLVADCTVTRFDPMSKAMLQIMGVFAEFEREMTVGRIKSGLKNAKANGVQMGRPRKTVADVPQHVKDLLPGFLAGKYDKAEYARKAEISRQTLYKYLRLMGEDGARVGQNKTRAADVPQSVLELLADYKAGKLSKTAYAKKAGITRPTLDKYLNLLGEG